VKLTRFRGHPNICVQGIHDGEDGIAAYAVAVFFLGLAYHHRVPPLPLVLLLTGYGALLEFGQLGVPGRHAQFADIGADVAGASIGVMVALAAMRLRSFALSR
jgi:VanZ family protein